MLEEIVSFLGVATLAVFGWAFTLSNRVTKIEAEQEGLRELINNRFIEVNRRLDNIEEKL
jgi:hypothetical protein